MQALCTAATGLTAQQQKIDIIANNIANLNTTAYKNTAVGFEDTYYTAMENPDSQAQPTNLQRGTGVALSSTAVDFSQGAVQATGNDLDFAIEGNAFFRLMNDDGRYVYTKDGSFTVSNEEDGTYLVNAEGYYVLDDNNDRIRLEDSEDGFVIQSDGSITGGERLGIYSFENSSGLLGGGGNHFYETASSGQAAPAENYTVKQGVLEGSNVDLGSQLSDLIQAQRVFSLSSRALQTADDMEGLANNLRR